MNIGVDGGALSITDDRLKVGVYRVAHNLVKELSAIDAKNNYRVYGFGRGGEPGNFVRLPQFGFQKVWQSLDMMTHSVDVYLGISQSLPFTLYDVRKIGFIYDVGFLDYPEYYPGSAMSLSRQTASLVTRAHHIVTSSHASAENILRHYDYPKEKISVAYLGVDAQFTAIGAIMRRNLPYFLFVGSLKPGKNIPMMIRSFAQFLKESKKFYELLIIGSDVWLDPEIERAIRDLKLENRVHMMGFPNDRTLASFYRGATALLTVSKIEGFGLPAVEAMASGTPLIASTKGSYPEIIKDVGLFVDPDDEKGLVKNMQKIITNTKLRNTCIERGIARATQFTWKSFAQSVLDIFSYE